MEPMLASPEHPEPDGPDDETPTGDTAERSRPRRRVELRSTPTRRALLLTALGGLLIAGVATVLPGADGGNRLTAGSIALGSRGNETFNRAAPGDCLNWPERTPDAAEIVDCAAEHRFEVAASIDMATFPGSEYGPEAPPPSPTRIQQISQEQCQAAVRRYLGPKYDPNSRFTVSMLWGGDKAWRQHGERRILCGLQLPGPNNQQLPYTGRVADNDQSPVWPAGTCLGIDPTTNQPTDIPVDCAAPHAMEVTGAVNLAERFGDVLPPEPDQDAFIKETCTQLTEGYLAPVKLRETTLTLVYSTISLPSWSAGSRQVSCSIGATLGNGGWSTLLNSAKAGLLINGQPPIPPPDIPEERLTLPAIPIPDPSDQQLPSESTVTSTQTSQSGSGQSGSGQSGSGQSGSGQSGQSTQHGPAQPTTQAPTTQAPTTQAPAAPAPGGAPDAGGNTFLNGPPPPPEAGQPAPAPAAEPAPAPGPILPIPAPGPEPGPPAP